MTGKFIVIEGLDGSGKTTQTGILINKLREKGIKAVNQAEPTSGEYGKMCRDVLGGRKQCAKSQLALLFTLDRIDHNLNKEDGINYHLENGETRLLNENLGRIAEILNVGTEELVLGYHPRRQTSTEDELADQYTGQITEIRKRYKAEIDTLTEEISRLRLENTELRRHIETQQDLIETKSELIVMLKKLAAR